MNSNEHIKPESFLDKIIWFSLNNKLVIILLICAVMAWGYMAAPFDWKSDTITRNPVPVDAIPDIGENQQIVFTKWMGRSPQDIEDQITYPLTTALLGIPGIKTIRSYSFFGFSTIYIIFNEDVEFYWSRSRILEKLNSLPSGTLPGGAQPSLGPDATALGQIFWYTLEGQDKQGNPTGGWDLNELRTVQDWYVKYGLMSASGVSEVASVGGYVKEYQVDVDPDAMRANHITLDQVYNAVRMANIDVGARNLEINNVEYFIRGIGFIKNLDDIGNAVITVNDNVPLYVKDVAQVHLGPAQRRGALDKGGAESVGGVVVVRYGENPLAVIKNVKKKIEELAPGLPKKRLSDGMVSQVTIVPFYDRTGLIYETLGTLNDALFEEILVTIIVVLLMLMHFRSSLLISGLLPIAVMMTFIMMKLFHVDANIVALSGIAIAIGTMVDMGIVICENILKGLDEAITGESRMHIVYKATSEIGSAVLTAVATTIISFLPVFTMEAAEGKLFKPLAYTKTFALIGSIVVALTVIPPLALMLFSNKKPRNIIKRITDSLYFISGLWIAVAFKWWLGVLLVGFALYRVFEEKIPEYVKRRTPLAVNILAVLVVISILAAHWLPFGPEKGVPLNLLFVGVLIGGLLGFFQLFQKAYPGILKWALNNKTVFLAVPIMILLLGGMSWQGFGSFFGWLPASVKRFKPMSKVAHAFPGLGREFMPPLDEGSFLYMPTTSVHASIGEVLDVLKKQDMGFSSIPEIDNAVGKLGRAETSLDPAPISMIETVINYKPQYIIDSSGKRLKFLFDRSEDDFFRDESGHPLPAPDGKPYRVQGRYKRDGDGKLIEDEDGVPFRMWRLPLDPELNSGREAWGGINSPNDIWDEIVNAGQIPGTTSAPKLQPIAARIVMLQSGMRAPMGVKVKGPDLETIEKVGLQIEKYLKEVPSIEPSTVIADRIVGKPYLEIEIDRKAIARYGIMLSQVQQVIEVAIGGKPVTSTVEGRERYPVRVRYLRELRNDIDKLKRVLVPAPGGAQIPLGQLSTIHYVRGPQVIKSEDTFLTGYVIFDKKPAFAEVDVVEQAQAYLKSKIESGKLQIPSGVSYRFSGSYENQVRAQKKLMIVLPLALFLIFLILYFQFRTVSTTLLVFSGIAVAWAGGFILIWLYGQSWFLNFSVLGTHLRDLFQVAPINLSVAIWVGFLALFGIATDDGVVIATYLDDSFTKKSPSTVQEIREATLFAGMRRVRPCLMTTATTVLALIPILTSTGRGSDIMVPMAIPSVGGMIIEVVTMLIVPVLYSLIKEIKLKINY